MSIHKSKILLVEDVKIAQKLAVLILHALGCDVDTTESGAQALDLICNKRYDLVLLDLGLPDLDGLTVTKAVRKKENPHRYIKIVALSAHSKNDEQIRQNCLNAGIDEYIQKPLTKELAVKLLDRFHIKYHL